MIPVLAFVVIYLVNENINYSSIEDIYIYIYIYIYIN